jgi:mycothiol synthase
VAVELRAVTTEADIGSWAAVRSAVTPENPVSVDSLRRDVETGARGLLLLATDGGVPAGCGSGKRSDVREAAFIGAWVLAGHRRRGVGSALLEALTGHAREIGVRVLRARTVEDQHDAVAFLEHRGFTAVAREYESRLDLREAATALAAVPEGVEIVSLHDRLDLAPQAHALAVAAFPDIPSGEDVDVSSFEHWRRENVDEALEGSFLALAEGRVVGSVGLIAQPRPGVAEHLLTAVDRDWRRRGVARALKQAQMAWARGAGYAELVTYNDAGNAAMRELNLRLGYVPGPVDVTFQRTLEDAGS